MASKRDHKSGFSLLELIIVLMVMVSLLAIVWPNLQRPLQRTSLSEAAETLRSAIDDGRYQAITTGTPVFVQLSQDGVTIRSGSFDSFMSDDGDVASRGTTLQPATIKQPGERSNQTDSRSTLRSWTLPESVVVSDVRWTLEPPPEELESSQTPASSPIAEVQSDAMMTAGFDSADSLYGAPSGQTWWLPLVANGQGRDAAIVLLDTSINEEITVTFASATGALEIVK